MDNGNGGFFEKLAKLTKPERGITLEAYVNMKLVFIENLTVTPAHPEFNENTKRTLSTGKEPVCRARTSHSNPGMQISMHIVNDWNL